ncbi:MAG: dipeptidase [Bacillota bacterium]
MKLIDLHCDTITELRSEVKPEKLNTELYRNTLCVDIEKLKKADSIAQFFAMYVSIKTQENLKSVCDKLIDKFYEELLKNKEHIAFASGYDMLQRNMDSGRLSAFLTIEEGEALEGDLDNLKHFYDRGVRLITLIWNHPNKLGYPNFRFEYQNMGLTDFGREVVSEMNRLGMLIDISHASDGVFYDVARLSRQPFVASHSNSREIKHHARNLTDDMIKLLAEKGGVTGINFEAWFLGEGDEAKISDMVRHIRHIHRVGGIEVLAMGTDFDGTTHAIEIKDISRMDMLYHALQKEGFTEGELEKIFYKNAIRVIKDVLK